MDAARRDRARRRAEWPGRRTTLEDQDDAMLVRHGTPAERIVMLWQATRDAWASSGRTLPTYGRAEIPGRITRDERV